MHGVQTMRHRAYAAGTLKTTPQETVVYQPPTIVIQPANPAVVYVPAYNPWIVYGAPVPVYPACYVAPIAPVGAVAIVGSTSYRQVGNRSEWTGCDTDRHSRRRQTNVAVTPG